MKTKLLDNQGEKVHVLVFDTGDEVSSGLLEFAKHHKISAARFTAIGAFQDLTLGYFEIEKKEYKKIPIREQVEVLSLVGNIAMSKGQPKLHAHVVVGKADGSAHGGHLLEAHVRPTLEVMLVELPAHLQRTMDDTSGLALINLSAK